MKALIADDDQVIRMILEKQLQSWGFDTVTASNGEEAFYIITEQEDPPRIVLLDWEMPKLDGIALCQKIRSSESNDPPYIILVTGHTDSDRIATALQAGANDFLSKPTKPIELRARLGVGMRTLELQRRLNLANHMLAYKAEHDELTGLRNRGSLIDRLDTEIARSQRTGENLAVGILDIDYFKRVNDTYGHPVGDRVLKEFAERMRDTFRPYDLLGRYGGEEFMVACSIPEEESKRVFERFRKAVAETPFLKDDLGLEITVSIGIRQYTGEPGSIKSTLLTLISDADAALYRAKNGGRNRVELTDHLESKNAGRHTDLDESQILDGEL